MPGGVRGSGGDPASYSILNTLLDANNQGNARIDSEDMLSQILSDKTEEVGKIDLSSRNT